MTTMEERAHQVRQMLANQRLEGLEPDQAHQQLLQEYIEGTASLDDLWLHARAYAEALGPRDIVEQMNQFSPELKLALHKQAVAEKKAQDRIKEMDTALAAIDYMVGDAALEGMTIDPLKVEQWKDQVKNGTPWNDVLKAIMADKQKIIAVEPKPEYPDRPGMKHMGNGYYLVSPSKD
jgi:hypothetical protein